MALNLVQQRSSRVIDFVTNRKRVLVVNSNFFGPYLAPFQRYGDLNVENRLFSLYPTPIPAKNWGCFFVVDPSCWGLQRVKWLG